MIKKIALFICISLSLSVLHAQQKTNNASAEQEIIQLSKQKWQWMSDKNVDSLSNLFEAQCNFVHMGGIWGKDRELSIIKDGFIWYKKAE